MPQNERPTQEPFIREEFRPDLSNYFVNYPKVPPSASQEEIKHAAGSGLSQRQLQALGLADVWFPADAWRRPLERHPEVSWTMIDDGQAVLLHVGSGLYFGLNPMAAAIWSALEKRVSAQTILTGVSRRYGIIEEQLAPALHAFFATLVGKHLIELSEPGAAGEPAAFEFTGTSGEGAEVPAYQDPWLMEHGSLVDLTHQSMIYLCTGNIKRCDKDQNKDAMDKPWR